MVILSLFISPLNYILGLFIMMCHYSEYRLVPPHNFTTNLGKNGSQSAAEEGERTAKTVRILVKLDDACDVASS